MPRYENRQPSEGINVTDEHPLKRFVQLAIAAAVLVVLLVAVLQFGGGLLARMVPFAVETRVVDKLDIDFVGDASDPVVERYLESLADRMLPALELPEGMRVSIHYDHGDTVNAFATLGGNLLFYRGLLRELPNENALAMVLAHEIAHVKHRDPAAGLGGGVASALAMAAVTGNAGAASRLLSRAGLLTGVQFTRRMELAADREAAAAVAAVYGHLGGAGDLFDAIARMRSGDATSKDVPAGASARVPRWLERFAATHPLDADRIDALADRAAELGVPATGEVTPIPEAVRRRLDDDD